ncbi:hypothetical protein SAMN04488118_1175 [Epibacterium ulvae]|uniref:Uncharacterized protein n=2 Tax=Epibacterium ulvae TaxID=1156985 RepID=A0A1G5RH39_9RHOB|nr:hypothetical protein SAMN04488118_1175 [Epibacterium ulvae]
MQILQDRLVAHGNRLWQLPFSYAGILAVSMGLAFGEDPISKASELFLALGVLGICVLFCMYGSYEGYARSATFMRDTEQSLGLNPSTAKVGWTNHVVPYFVIAILCTVGAFSVGLDPSIATVSLETVVAK